MLFGSFTCGFLPVNTKIVSTVFQFGYLKFQKWKLDKIGKRMAISAVPNEMV